ncbi:MAG: TlpA family protein disulfide reductase, partial [Candidatus Eremiobacteraeota bacterium]|nr:TlpA family protein disulfide reductase [Candidatus Eremiobacteraeota bacterium]
VHVFIDKHGNVSTYRLGEMDRAAIDDAIKKIL